MSGNTLLIVDGDGIEGAAAAYRQAAALLFLGWVWETPLLCEYKSKIYEDHSNTQAYIHKIKPKGLYADKPNPIFDAFNNAK